VIFQTCFSDSLRAWLPRVFHTTWHIYLRASDWRRQVDSEARHQTRAEDGAGVKEMTAKKTKAKAAVAGQLAPFDVVTPPQ
jgi:hypothetical protein